MGVRDVIKHRGLFASLYTDRGSYYWYTPEAGSKVAKENPTQFGKAMARLGIERIPAYSPERLSKKTVSEVCARPARRTKPSYTRTPKTQDPRLF